MTLKNILSFLFLFSFALPVSSCSSDDPNEPGKPTPPSTAFTMPEREMRAVWVATVDNMDWPKNKYDAKAQKDEYIKYLDLFEQYNINTVIMQVRPMADAFYKSTLEPWSQYITGTQGKDPGYDVLKFLIDETHKRGIEFHAWLNPYRISNNADTFKPAPGHIYTKHPEWTMRYNRLLIFRPALQEVRQFLVDVIDELITKYDVDGIHFDDYFYPYPQKGVILDDQEDFAKNGSDYDNIDDFRRGNVNKAIEAIHNLIVQKRPDIIFSISPYGVWRNKSKDPLRGSYSSTSITNYDDLYADVLLWCKNGWVDLVVPQLYASTENIAMNFTKMSAWWSKSVGQCPLAIGYGVYKFGNPAEGAIYVNDPKELETEFFFARRHKAVIGSFIFNASVFKNNKINILSNLSNVYPEKALVPFMGRKTCAAPSRIDKITVSGKTITWNGQDSNYRYVIYEIANGKAKIVDIVSNASYNCIKTGTYAVSTLNKDNIESELSQHVNIN